LISPGTVFWILLSQSFICTGPYGLRTLWAPSLRGIMHRWVDTATWIVAKQVDFWKAGFSWANSMERGRKESNGTQDVVGSYIAGEFLKIDTLQLQLWWLSQHRLDCQ
jgi:hypothetical protein